MAKSAATIASQPASHDFVDLEQSGGTLDLRTWSAARNVRFTDVGTVERRPGLRSIHTSFSASGQPVETEATPPDTYSVGGLYHFRTTHNTGYESNLYLAKVDDFLVASQFGREFEIPVAKGLGGSGDQAYFAEVYRDSELKRYLIVGSSNPKFGIRYWDGVVTTVGQSYDADKWGYMERIPWVPVEYQFGVEHNRRFFAAGKGTTVLYSLSNDFLEFGGQLIMEPRWGPVTGFMPTYYGELLVGQERAISKVIFDSGLPVASETVTIEYGLVGPNASTHLGNDIVFMSTKGQLTTVATTDRFGSLETGLLSKRVFRRFDDLPRAGWNHVWIEDDPVESILWVGHPRRTGLKNDALTGWNYKSDRFEYVENKSLIGPSCGAVMATSTAGRPTLHVGFYDTFLGGVSASEGRVFSFDGSHKEDSYLGSRTEGDGSADQSIGDSGKVIMPGHAPLGRASGMVASDATLTGTYTQSPTKTTIILRITGVSGGGVGVIGTTASITAEVYDIGNSSRGALTQDLGSAYTPGSAFDVTNGTDTGLNLALPAETVRTGEELFIHIHNRRAITETWVAAYSDLAEGNIISTKSAGTARNFLPYVETPPVVYGDAHQDVRVDGVSVMLRVKGNRADTQTNDVDNFTNQNPYRFMVDLYVKVDKDATWQHVAILDSNSAQKPHLDESQAEIAGASVDRLTPGGALSLQHVTSSDDTEANGTPMASDDDVSLEYVKIERTGKVFQFRLGQETAMSGGTDSTFGFRNADFEIVGLHVHATPQRETGVHMADGSLTVRVA